MPIMDIFIAHVSNTVDGISWNLCTSLSPHSPETGREDMHSEKTHSASEHLCDSLKMVCVHLHGRPPPVGTVSVQGPAFTLPVVAQSLSSRLFKKLGKIIYYGINIGSFSISLIIFVIINNTFDHQWHDQLFIHSIVVTNVKPVLEKKYIYIVVQGSGKIMICRMYRYRTADYSSSSMPTSCR